MGSYTPIDHRHGQCMQECRQDGQFRWAGAPPPHPAFRTLPVVGFQERSRHRPVDETHILLQDS